ncbi:MAG: type IV pilin N-terminal domain-containing protein [Methanoregula sp.]|nr:type IV pilin N-terminal domain-containing protein [Methanoregula sp.]
MRIDRSEKRKTDTSSGVSETVGAIMLISIVAILIAVIGVYLFSQPVPQKIPNLNFMTGVNSDKTKLYIYHNGGDTMIPGEFSVLLDGVPRSYSVSGGGSWSLGKNLEVDITPSTMPQSVQLVYNNTASSGGPGSTGAVLLDEASVNIVSSGNVSPDQLPYLDCSAVRNWDCRFQIPFEIILDRIVATSKERRINFVRNNAGNPILGQTGTQAYHFNITVSKKGYNSSIVFGDGKSSCNAPKIIPLGPNDRVDLVFDKTIGPTTFIMYGIAPTIWEMAGGTGDEMTIRTWNSTTLVWQNNAGNALCHTWITEYSTLDSSLDIDTSSATGSGTGYTNLIVNETTILDGAFGGSVVLDNFVPTENGMFLVSYPGSSVAAPIYMIGWANKITVDGWVL